jgi:hypothetical protein
MILNERQSYRVLRYRPAICLEGMSRFRAEIRNLYIRNALNFVSELVITSVSACSEYGKRKPARVATLQLEPRTSRILGELSQNRGERQTKLVVNIYKSFPAL